LKWRGGEKRNINQFTKINTGKLAMAKKGRKKKRRRDNLIKPERRK
jgi:ribosomal protein L2